MGKMILVTGGARSGKSSFAETRVAELGENILYIATAIPFDDEMKDRIRKHQSSRPSHWETWEGYRGLGAAIKKAGKEKDGVLVDCVTIMVTNIMLSHSEVDFEQLAPHDMDRIEEDIRQEVTELIEGIQASDCDVVLVTNELGSGLVPENPMGRAFRDFAGRANQMIGRAADELWLAVCGVPMKIK